jgi:hypothetical protein
MCSSGVQEHIPNEIFQTLHSSSVLMSVRAYCSTNVTICGLLFNTLIASEHVSSSGRVMESIWKEVAMAW